MNHQLVPLFSVPLFKTNIGEMDEDEKSWVTNLDFPFQSVGLYQTETPEEKTDQGMYLLKQKNISKLHLKIKETISFFTKQVLDISDEFEISTSWINRYKETEINPKHSHPNALISGVYYVDSDETSAPIVFEKPYLYTNLFHSTIKASFQNKNHNQFNTDYYGLKPVTGDLYMFPSWLEHYVPPQTGNKTRYSIAFNAFIKGKIGVGTEQLHI